MVEFVFLPAAALPREGNLGNLRNLGNWIALERSRRVSLREYLLPSGITLESHPRKLILSEEDILFEKFPFARNQEDSSRSISRNADERASRKYLRLL